MKLFYIKRLAKLAKFLREKVPSGQFDLTTWTTNYKTVACACGWACEIPAFKRAGLCLGRPYFNRDKTDYDVFFNGKENFDAASEFFGISYDDAAYLFCPEQYPKNRKGKMAVVKRIENFVNRQMKERQKTICKKG